MINAGIPLPSQPGSALRAKTRHSPPYGVICHWLTSTNEPSGRSCRLTGKAFRLDHTDARVLMELDQLYKRLNRPHIERLCFLEQHIDIVMTRDDLYLEYVTLLNQTGQYREAIRRIDQRKFHPWEGGEGKVPAQYQLARLELAKELINRKNMMTHSP